jgi:hypothetical protein
METGIDKYEMSGGDAAWNAWLDICSVAGVRKMNPDLSAGLETHIASAMTTALARTGFASEEFRRDDPVSFFDSYFLLGSERSEAKGKKPLKQFYKHQLANQRIPLKELVCGILFSPRKGKIRDIVREWIATVKGWCPHSITQADGKRKIVWESAAENELEVSERIDRYASGLDIDSAVLKREIEEVFLEMENELMLEKVKIALLLYMTAQNKTLDNPAVLEILGVGKSRAYMVKDKCMENMAEILNKHDIKADDVMFATQLMSTCRAILGNDFINSIEG